MPSRSLASAAGLRDFPFVKAKQIRVDPQPEQFAFDVPAILVRAGQEPRRAGVPRQRRAEASPLMRLDRAPQPDVVMNVLCPLEALDLFKDLPGEGPLFPYLSRVRAGDRATEFGQRCRQLGIKGVTLHSYRYSFGKTLVFWLLNPQCVNHRKANERL